jgi:hypothetical protein
MIVNRIALVFGVEKIFVVAQIVLLITTIAMQPLMMEAATHP